MPSGERYRTSPISCGPFCVTQPASVMSSKKVKVILFMSGLLFRGTMDDFMLFPLPSSFVSRPFWTEATMLPFFTSRPGGTWSISLPRHGHFSRADDLFDAYGSQQFDECLELLFVPRYLEGIGPGRGINHAGAKDIRYPERLGPVLHRGVDLDKAHFAFHILFLGEVGHLDDIDELVELLDDLFEDALIARSDDRHLRDRGIESGADRYGLDIEPPAAEQPGHPRQYAEFVLYQYGYDMFHSLSFIMDQGNRVAVLFGPREPCRRHRNADTVGLVHNYFTAFNFFSAFFSSPKIISWMAAPAGTMGNTFSYRSITKSMNTGRLILSASSNTGTTSDGFSARRPTAPYASASFTKSGVLPRSVDEYRSE